MANTPLNTSFVADIKNIIQEARKKTYIYHLRHTQWLKNIGGLVVN